MRLAGLGVVPSAVGAQQGDDVVVVRLIQPADLVLARLDRGRVVVANHSHSLGRSSPRCVGRAGKASRGTVPTRGQPPGGVGLVEDVDEQGDGGVGPAEDDEVAAAREAW